MPAARFFRRRGKCCLIHPWRALTGLTSLNPEPVLGLDPDDIMNVGEEAPSAFHLRLTFTEPPNPWKPERSVDVPPKPAECRASFFRAYQVWTGCGLVIEMAHEKGEPNGSPLVFARVPINSCFPRRRRPRAPGSRRWSQSTASSRHRLRGPWW